MKPINPESEKLNAVSFTHTSESEITPSSSLSVQADLMDLALERVPTGGNAKPFHWEWVGETLKITHADHFDPHYLTRNNHTLLLTLGCMIESAVITARFQGFDSHYVVDESNLLTEITFSKATDESDCKEEFFKLLKRSTFRGALEQSPAPKVSDPEGKVASSSAITSDFKKFLVKADTYMWIQTKAAISFFKEVRFFDKQRGPRGIRSADLGVGKFDQAFLYTMSYFPKFLSWMVRTPVLNSLFVNTTKRNIQNAHFVVMTAKDLKPQSLIEAGRISLRTWLELENQGYSVQPYSTASITLVDAANGALPEDTLEAFRKLFTTVGPEVCKNQFQLSPGQHVVWMFRVGTRLQQ